MKKNIYYYRAVGHNDHPFDLGASLKPLLHQLPDVASTEIQFSDETIRIQKRKIDGNDIYLHLIKFVPGEVAATVLPKAKSIDDLELPQAATKGREFKGGECFLLIRKHHMIFCSNGISTAKATLYIHLLHQKNSKKVEFNFKVSTDLNKLAILEKEGVKSVKLNVHAFAVSIPTNRNGWFQKAVGAIKDEISAIASKDLALSEEKALEDLIVSVELGLDGNRRAAESARMTVKDIAKQIIETDESNECDSFVIMTQADTPIKPETLKLHDTIKVNKVNGSLNHGEAWSGMETFLRNLTNGHLLEQ
ncbi:Uncharacterised protein [Pseudomonas luteola]|uniref:DUF4747 family protein n=1 Tax=Pseudomonas luteola TaxID=47886 RepID=A0A2X2CIN8_PSELU|nr:hypothetical protein [Pseudomonas luteola]SPZ07588.1 Uncharacterised protein [Pseudomonas luteola]